MNKKNVVLIFFIFVSVLSIIIIKPISDLDELWNYNTARAISEGLLPYKDISMITTPLLPIIVSIFLKLIVNEVIISRILSGLLWTGILFTVYKIFNVLIKEDNICLIGTIFIGFICRHIYCIDYNVTILFMSLIILYQELKRLDSDTKCNKKYDLLIGILAGLAICTKQSIGVTLAGTVILYKIVLIQNRTQIKKCIESVLTRIIGICIPIVILFIYLICINAISEFINYAVLGISTFSNKIPYTALFQNDKIEIRLFAIIIPITIILMLGILIITKILKKENKILHRILTIFIYSFSIIIVMYPISDEIHFLIGSLISIIELIYIICLLGKKAYNKITYNKKYKIYKIITLIIWLLMSVVIITKCIDNLYQYIIAKKNIEIQHYKKIEIDDDLKETIKQIDEYILKKEQEGKKVYILDAEAAVYMIPIDHYNKDYDMFLKGNIGKDGEQGQIQKIEKKDKNTFYLIKKKNLRLNWQTPVNVINYIRENLELVEEISIYEVYR